MKILALTIAAGLLLSAGTRAQVPLSPKDIKLGKVQPAVVKTPEFQITGGSSKRYKLGEWLEMEVEYSTAPEDIDELTFKFTAMIEKKLLIGQVTYINIPKGREHYAVMYIAPRSLEKFTGGRPLTPQAIENVWVTVERQGQTLGTQSFKPAAIPNMAQIPGLVLNKDETPFAPLYYDRYEAIKKSTR
jgi:hypothetical protein